MHSMWEPRETQADTVWGSTADEAVEDVIEHCRRTYSCHQLRDRSPEDITGVEEDSKIFLIRQIKTGQTMFGKT